MSKTLMVVERDRPTCYSQASQMQIGDVAQILQWHHSVGYHLMKTYQCFVELERPNYTYNQITGATVRVLEKGETLTLRVIE
jgi:hypothetical protein